MAEYDPIASGNYNIGEIWDPALKRNVYLGNQSVGEYIGANQKNYKGYTGAITNVQGRPITPQAFGFPSSNPPKTGPTGFNPEQYRATRERSALAGEGQVNPYSDEYNTQMNDITKAIRMIPGTRPDIGVTAGSPDIYDLVNWDLINPKNYGSRRIDPVTQQFAQIASRAPITPSFREVSDRTGFAPSGRGYNYRGAPSAEETELSRRFLAGDMRAGQELAKVRGGRIQLNDLSGMQKFGNKFYGPLVASLAALPASFAGPIWGPIIGAGMGALSSGGMSRWQNPSAVALGAAGGAAGGYGGGQAATALGFGPVAKGALQGAGTAAGGNIGRSVGTGNWNVRDLVRDIAVGGASGAAGGYVGSRLGPQPGMTPEQEAATRVPSQLGAFGARGAVNTAADFTWPRSTPTPKRRPQPRGRG